MKTLLGILSLTGLLAFGVACSRDGDMQREDVRDGADIQREEAMDADDIRETDTYNRSVPLESDDEVEVDRDVLGDDEVEIND